MTNMVRHMTNMVHHMTNMVHHMTNMVHHMTNMVRHMTNVVHHMQTVMEHQLGVQVESNITYTTYSSFLMVQSGSLIAVSRSNICTPVRASIVFLQCSMIPSSAIVGSQADARGATTH